MYSFRSATSIIFTVILYGVLTIVIFSDVINGSKSFLISHDATIQTYAWLTKIFRATQSGELSLWSFGTFSGSSFVGELQTGPLYPLALFIAFFSVPGDPWFVDIFIVIHFFIACVSMHTLCRELGLMYLSTIFGSLIFAFASDVSCRAWGQPNLYAGIVYIPFGIATAIHAIRSTDKLLLVYWSGLCGATTSLSFLAGHMYGTIYMLLAEAVSLFVVYWMRDGASQNSIKKNLFVYALIVTFTVTLISPQLAATIQYFSLAYKWYGSGYTSSPHVVPYKEYAKFCLHIKDIATVFSGNNIQSLDGGTLFITNTAIVIIFLASIFSSFHKRRAIAVVIGATLVSISLVIGFSAPFLLGHLIYHIPVLNSIRIPSRALTLYALGMALIAAASLNFLISRFNIYKSILWLALPLLVLISTGFESFKFINTKLLSVINQNYPATNVYNNSIIKTLLSFDKTELSSYRIYFHTDSIPANLGDIFPLLTTTGFRSSQQMNYYDYFDWNPQSSRMDFLAVKFWVSENKLFDLPIIAHIDNLYIYERPNALPIFWILKDDGSRIAAPISSIDWSQNMVTVHFISKIMGTLVFAQPNFPGWKIMANGKWLPNSTVDIFMAANLIEPSDSVSFCYAPRWSLPLLTLSLVTVVSIIGLHFYLIHTHKWKIRPILPTFT